jgi:gliding-associated putative ABC transporter substrate-binding component GldG
MRPWPYNPVLNNYNGKHPVTKNVDAIEGKFVSTVDTLAVPGITKTILLRTSSQSRYLNAPARVNFNIVDPKFAPTDQQYNKPELPVAVLLEGKFPSAFRSIRPTVRTLQSRGYGYTDTSYMAEGKPSKQIVIGDGDLIKNYVDQTGKPDMLGVNYTERYIFGNKDFAMNCIEYLCDQNGLIETRAKEVKLRPLDDQRVDDDRTQWQVVNMLAPLFLLYIFSGIYFFIRHRKYAA